MQKVYKGLNGSAFLSEKDAKETFQNNYSLNYKVDGQVFDNTYSAREYYLNVKLKQLEDNAIKTICYEQGAMCQTKEQITSWLRDNTVKGFEYQGKDFSNLNYSEFLLAMNDLDDQIIDKNIKPVLNADRSSYWVTQNTKSSSGYFVGPKYFESNEAVNSVAKFQPIKSYDVNAFALPIAGWAFAGITSLVLDSLVKEPVQSNYEMIKFLETTFNKLNLDIKLLKNFEDKFYKSLSKNLQQDLSYGLDDIKDSELNDFYRLLISFKRFLDITKIYDLDIKTDELELTLKQIVVEILNSQKEFMNNMLDINNDKNGANILLDSSISFDDIYSLFLNTNAFFNDGGTKKILWDIAENILRRMDKVMEIIGSIADNIGKVTDNIGKVTDNIGKMKTTTNKNEKEFTTNVEKNNQLVTETLIDNSDLLIKELGLNLDFTTNYIGPAALLLAIPEMISAVWNLGQMLSFISLKTYEAKLDSNQSLYYFEPTFKIPLLDISFAQRVQDQNIHVLNQSPLSYFSPKQDGKELNELYEFNGKYYKDKKIAIDDLKYEIYKKPENFLKTKELFTSVLSKDNNHILNINKICSTDEEQKNRKDSCISAYEYEKEVSKQSEEYIQRLFKQYYENTGKEYYLDGFGGAYDNKDIAIQQLKNKVDYLDNYQKVYSYKIYNNKIVKDTEQEIKDYIKANQYIESKTIINTDLIQTKSYDLLKENNGYDFDIYEMSYYGQIKYFRSHLEAMNYLDKKVNYEVYSYNREEKTYDYKGVEFINNQQFIQWVNSQIEVVSQKDFTDSGGEISNVKTYFNSFSYI
ncbi:hypothetical protein [Spiroplasma floricola]|uniref:Uncharacterized protein n=1 Tax=Spiroplasma floricola 23-6 TaxID=1336749 RepID=A0A2K8SDS7_9MOLU|nr:hypothetical protein [Spiroplasma floricola]AUB31616.1 hypothetical protein SFLOR_v1c05640 [Spiroplasma floricola 23-6]